MPRRQYLTRFPMSSSKSVLLKPRPAPHKNNAAGPDFSLVQPRTRSSGIQRVIAKPLKSKYTSAEWSQRRSCMYPGRNFPPRRQNRRENVNESIRVREVRAVFPDGTSEIMPTAQALRKAQDLGLDLVLVSPTAVPPVAKAVDYGHYQYEQKKKQHEAKKKQHVVLVKELKFRPNTDDHDYEFKKNHAIRFLKEGNRVKAVVQFRGREIAHVDLGKKLLLRFAEDLATHGQVEGQPRLEGRNAHVIISPVKPGSGKPEKPAPAPH